MNILIDDDFKNIPFEERGDYSFWEGFFLSLKMLIFSPKSFFKKMHVNKGFKKPLIFALIIASFSILISNLYTVLGLVDTPKEQMAKMLEYFPNEQLSEVVSSIPDYSFSMSLIINQVFSYFLGLLMLISVWHLGLFMIGAARNGYQATFRIICYSAIASSVNLLPLNGSYLFVLTYLWWTVLIFFGISEAHELKFRKALIATFFPIILLFLFSALMI